jgi:hypothetical protein
MDDISIDYYVNALVSGGAFRETIRFDHVELYSDVGDSIWHRSVVIYGR